MTPMQEAVRAYGQRALAVTLSCIAMVAAAIVGYAAQPRTGVTSPDVSAFSAAATVGAQHAAAVGHQGYPDCSAGRVPCIHETENGFLLTDQAGKDWAITVGDDYTRHGVHYWLLITGDLSAKSLYIIGDCAHSGSDEPCVSTDEDATTKMHDHVHAPWAVRVLDSWSYDHGTWYVTVCADESATECPVLAS